MGTKQSGGVGTGMHSWHFIEDTAYNRTSASLRRHALPLAKRNSSVNNANQGYVIDTDGQPISHSTVNDVAVTVLPNAPTNPETGLPMPTIAVATSGGVSVIKDDGLVVTKNSYLSNYNHTLADHIAFDGEDIVFHVWNNTSFHTVVRWDYELTTLKGQYTTYEATSNNINNSLKLPFDTTTNANGPSGRAVIKTDDGVALAFDGYVVNAISDGNPQKDLINLSISITTPVGCFLRQRLRL